MTTSPPPTSAGVARLLQDHVADAEQRHHHADAEPEADGQHDAADRPRRQRAERDPDDHRACSVPSTIAPSRICIVRLARAATAGSWVTTTTAVPSRLSRSKSTTICGARRLVELARRLVGEQQRRPVGQRARDRHALHFAAGQLRRPMRCARAESRRTRAARACAARRCGPRRRPLPPAAARRSPTPSASAAGRSAGRRSRCAAGAAGCAPRRPGGSRRRPPRTRVRSSARRCSRAGAAACSCRSPTGPTMLT